MEDITDIIERLKPDTKRIPLEILHNVAAMASEDGVVEMGSVAKTWRHAALTHVRPGICGKRSPLLEDIALRCCQQVEWDNVLSRFGNFGSFKFDKDMNRTERYFWELDRVYDNSYNYEDACSYDKREELRNDVKVREVVKRIGCRTSELMSAIEEWERNGLFEEIEEMNIPWPFFSTLAEKCIHFGAFKRLSTLFLPELRLNVWDPNNLKVIRGKEVRRFWMLVGYGTIAGPMALSLEDGEVIIPRTCYPAGAIEVLPMVERHCRRHVQAQIFFEERRDRRKIEWAYRFLPSEMEYLSNYCAEQQRIAREIHQTDAQHSN